MLVAKEPGTGKDVKGIPLPKERKAGNGVEEILEPKERKVADVFEEIVESKERKVADVFEEIVESKERKVADVVEEILESKERKIADVVEEILEPKERKVADVVEEIVESKERKIADVVEEILEPKERKVADVVEEIVESKERKAANDVEEIVIPHWSDCVDVQNAGHNTSGAYTITLNGTGELVNVLCDMNTDGGGWTVFQNRFDGSVDFYRNYSDYERGFGNMTGGEFWLGLIYISQLTQGETSELRIDLTAADGTTAYEKFLYFIVFPERPYQILLKSPHGSLDPKRGFTFSHKQRFSTYDNDNVYNGAAKCHAGGWFKYCAYEPNLNGYYNVPGRKDGYEGRKKAGMTFQSFKGHESLKKSKMMLRRMK